MRIVVSAQGEGLEAAASPVFGRCPTYMFVDTDTLEAEAMANPAMSQGGGAGIQAAQFVVAQGAQAVLTGNLGPNAYDVLEAAGVPGYLVAEGTVRQAVDAYLAGKLQSMAGATVVPHAGMAPHASMGTGAGKIPQTGMGSGGGMGGGGRAFAAADANAPRRAELEALQEKLRDLRQQLALTMEQIEKLEQEG